MSEKRNLTSEEFGHLPAYFHDPFFSLEDNLVYATFNSYPVSSPNARFPWVNVTTQKRITIKDLEEVFPQVRKIRKLDWTTLSGSFKKKNVSWNFLRKQWVYGNNRAV